MTAPLCVDLFCGDGGWTDGFLDAGFRVIGYDIVRMPNYRGQLVLQDVRTLDGRKLRGATVFVASPPCTEFSSLAAIKGSRDPDEGMILVRETMRVIREARPRFWALENVRAAVRYISREIGQPRVRKHAWYVWGNFPGFILPSSDRLTKGLEGRMRTGHTVVTDRTAAARIPYPLARSLADAVMGAII